MRILIFNWKDISNPNAGGAEVFTHQIAKRWVEWGHEVTLFARSYQNANPSDSMDGISIIRRGTPFSVYREARRWYTALPRGSFDVVIDSTNTRPFLSPKYVTDAPVVWMIYQLARNVWFHETPLPAALVGRFILEPLWLRNYLHVPTITISKSSESDLRKLGVRDISVVPIGVDIPAQVRPFGKESTPTLIYVGRLARNKRPHHAIAAFLRFRREYPSVRLWVVGSGPLEDRLIGKQPEGVEFLGVVSEKEKFELMSRAHGLMATSVREGWGLIVTEAACVGTPSIGYGVEGLRDSLSDADGVAVWPPTPRTLARELPEFLKKALSLDFEPRPAPTWDMTAKSVLIRLEDVVEAGIRKA